MVLASKLINLLIPYRLTIFGFDGSLKAHNYCVKAVLMLNLLNGNDLHKAFHLNGSKAKSRSICKNLSSLLELVQGHILYTIILVILRIFTNGNTKVRIIVADKLHLLNLVEIVGKLNSKILILVLVNVRCG